MVTATAFILCRQKHGPRHTFPLYGFINRARTARTDSSWEAVQDIQIGPLVNAQLTSRMWRITCIVHRAQGTIRNIPFETYTLQACHTFNLAGLHDPQPEFTKSYARLHWNLVDATLLHLSVLCAFWLLQRRHPSPDYMNCV